MTIYAIYDPKTTYVCGCYDSEQYKSIDIEAKTITTKEGATCPFVEITKEEQELIPQKQMCVIDGVCQEYQPPALTEAELIKEAIEAKEAEINAQRDLNVNKSILHQQGGKDYYFKRSISAHLSWLFAGDKDSDTDYPADDNTIVRITKWHYKNITTHLGKRDNQEYILGRKRKDEVLKLTSVEAIKNYDITSIPE